MKTPAAAGRIFPNESTHSGVRRRQVAENHKARVEEEGPQAVADLALAVIALGIVSLVLIAMIAGMQP
jgi:hypothetical protein